MKFQNQRGIIPLFFLIPFVLIATGVVGIQSGYFRNIATGFFKFLAPPSPSNLPQQLSQFQQDPTRTPTPTAKLEGEIQTKPYTLETSKVQAGIPSFTINAPSGWVKTSPLGSEIVRFESPEIDSEKVKGGTITTNAIINIKATDSYSNLADFVSQYKSSGSKVKGYQLLGSTSVKDGQSLELTYQKKIGDSDIRIHELNYLFYQNGVSFLVKGYASDSAWGKHTGEIQSALNSFKFN